MLMVSAALLCKTELVESYRKNFPVESVVGIFDALAELKKESNEARMLGKAVINKVAGLQLYITSITWHMSFCLLRPAHASSRTLELHARPTPLLRPGRNANVALYHFCKLL